MVTHPFHPLHGREFVVLSHYHGWGEERVCFEADDGRTKFIPLGWTSLCAPDPLAVVAAGRSAFRADDLLELAGIVESLLRHGGGS